MRKTIILSLILAVTLGMASQAFAGLTSPITAKLKCDAQLKLKDAQICDPLECLDVVEELNGVLGTNYNKIQQFNLDCAQAISATVAIALSFCGEFGNFRWLVPPLMVPSASGEIVNMTVLCVESKDQ